jgi:hypothetical protein
MASQREPLQTRLDVLASTVRGAGEIRRESGGIRLSRLPRWAQTETDAIVTDPAAQTSGVRLEFLTSASQIELTVRFSRSELVVLSRPIPTAKIAVDADGRERILEFDEGDLRRFNQDNTVEHLSGEATTARIQLDDVPTPRKVVIWLPTDAEVELVDLAANRGIKAAPRDQLRWTHYGSSISHCSGADDPLGPWPVITARALNLDLYNLGIAGAAQIDGFAARSIRDQDADLITLKMGINVVNADSLRMRTFRPAVHSFLDTIRDGHPTTPILLISPILCPPHEDAPGPTEWSADWKALASQQRGSATEKTPCTRYGRSAGQLGLAEMLRPPERAQRVQRLLPCAGSSDHVCVCAGCAKGAQAEQALTEPVWRSQTRLTRHVAGALPATEGDTMST